MKKIMTATIAMFVFLAGTTMAELIFIDNFSNDIVEDSDTIEGFWSEASRDGNDSGITETGGQWIMTAGKRTASGSADYMMQSAVGPSFNFASGPGLIFEATGRMDAIGGMPGDHARMRFLISTDLGKINSSDNAFDLVYQADNTGQMRIRKDASTSTLVSFDLSDQNQIAGFRMELTGSGYALSLFDEDGETLFDAADSYVITTSAWDDGAAVSFMVFDTGTDIDDARAEYVLDQFSISVIPEPTTVSLFVVSCLATLGLRRMAGTGR